MLSVDLDRGRACLASAVSAFVSAVDAASEWELLGSSRCHGWSRLEVLPHLIDGWFEVFGGLLARTEAAPTVDAATYWTAYADAHVGSDPVAVLVAQRRRGSSYSRPEAARRQLRDVAGQLLDALPGLIEGNHRFQGLVLRLGDLLATWAVETVVHQLDLDLPGELPHDVLALARETVEEIAGPLPEHWSDSDAVLIGTGRRGLPADAPAELAELADRLPAFG